MANLLGFCLGLVLPFSCSMPCSFRGRSRWSRVAPELDGRLNLDYRRNASQLLLDSFATGSNIVTVTRGGCLSVYDFNTLYCSTYGPTSEVLAKPRLHISKPSVQFLTVRWSPLNRDEVACTKHRYYKVFLYDVYAGASRPTTVLRTDFDGSRNDVCLNDISFASNGESRLFAASTDGLVLMWDTRISNIRTLQLAAPESDELYSIELDNENKIVFAGNRWGRIFAWDLRAVRENIQNNNQTPLLAKWNIPEIMSNMPSPKKIPPKLFTDRIRSINLNPCCSYQLAFHRESGWSGVLNLFTNTVAHVHCPQVPLWWRGNNYYYTKRASWLPTCSIYAVGSACNKEVYLLDFSPNKSSVCHINFEEEQNRPTVGNKAVSISAPATACLAHPHTTTLIAGTTHSSLHVISQKAHAM